MPSDPHLILTLASAGSSAVAEATRALKARGYQITQEPAFGADSGGASLERDDVEVHISWLYERGVTIHCRNRQFEKEKEEIVELLRAFRNQK